MTLRYAYYPGCASQEITKESSDATRLLCKELGIELRDMPAANCCGAGLMKDHDYKLHLAMNARILAEAEEMGMDILTICSTCLMVMSIANRDLLADPELLNEVNELTSKGGVSSYKGTVKVKHLLWVLAGDYGLDKLKARVTRPFKGISVAPFYGCHTLRPSDALGFDDPASPTSLESVMEALGADTIDYEGRTKCCGFQTDLVNLDVSMKLTGKRISSARDAGADAMVTPCPFCHINLDSYQKNALQVTLAGAKDVSKRGMEMPVLHFTEAVALALGIDAKKLGLSRHMVSTERILKQGK